MWNIIKLILLLLISCDGHTQNCIVPIGNTDFHWPLVFNQYFELYPVSSAIGNDGPTRTVVKIEDGVEVNLFCAPNYLKSFHQKSMIKVKCQAATNQFSYESLKVLNINELTCNVGVMEEIITPVAGCERSELTSTQFGFIALGENSKCAVMVGEACYQVTEGYTRFAHVKLGGPGASELEQKRIDIFRSPKYPDFSYKLDFFRALAFEALHTGIEYNWNQKPAKFYVTQNYIDDLLLPHQQFQSIKTLGWNYFIAHTELKVLKKLKSDIRKTAAAQHIDIYVGSHGVKVLQDNGVEELEVYLKQNGDKRRFPMPALIWYLVIAEKQATGFVVLNGVHNEEQDFAAQHGINCKNECATLSWLKHTLAEKDELGGLLCCTYEELKAHIEEVPELENIEGLFV